MAIYSRDEKLNTGRFRTAVFLGLLALALGFCLALVFPFLTAFAWALVLAVLVAPVHSRILRRLQRPTAAAAVSCLLVIVAFLLPVTLIGAELTDQSVTLAGSIQAAVQQGELSRWLRPLDIPAVRAVLDWLKQRLDLSQLDLATLVGRAIGQVSSFLAKLSVNAVGNLVTGLMQVGLALITLFFLLRDAPRLRRAMGPFIPLDGEQTEALLRRMTEMIHATLYGAIVVAVTQGTLGGLAFWVLGLPSPLLWGTVMVTLCFVPLVGAPVVWVPAALALAATGAHGKALALVLWGVLVIGLVDNLLRPLVIGSRTQLHPLIVFFSVFGGLLLVGPVGLALGPMILAATLALLEVLQRKLAEPGMPALEASTALPTPYSPAGDGAGTSAGRGARPLPGSPAPRRDGSPRG